MGLENKVARRAKGWDSSTLPIADPREFGRVLRAAIKERFLLDPLEDDLPWGAKTSVLRSAAERTGVSRVTLHHFVHEEKANTSWRTLNKLRSWLGPSQGEALLTAATSEEQRQRRRDLEDYLEREVRRLEADRTPEDDYLGGPQVREEVEDFHRYVRVRGQPAPRARLGMLRVFDPIIGWKRLRSEITRKELLRIVRLGFTREKILVRAEVRALKEQK